MAKKRATKTEAPKTTAQQLGSLIKSARDIMRKDRGLNGDLDRLPMLTWVMFLKFLDDVEQNEEVESKLAGKKYRPAIEAPYRWRDWAARKDGITGDELIKFINNDEAVCPDGKKGAGLFAYLRSLQGRNGDGRRDVIANVFRGVINRMISGYLLRDVVNLVDSIHFGSAEEIHTLSHLYESMLREMRDTAGDSGEFYTPRPVVRFMVEAIDPQLGEVILDPACGTAGFLVESYRHLEKQCKKVEDFKLLQEKSIFGGEAKPLPYMLAQMNLLLHGLRSPRVAYGNSLAVKLTEIGNRDRVDIILTNPPFGGEEEAGIRGNFPADKQTSETALLFLQLIMRKLKRAGSGSENGGRAAVVVPNGLLSAGGVTCRIRQQLLSEFNLYAVVRLPHNVFAPYTDVATNLLFFNHSGPTKKILFCDVPLPPETTLSKTKPFTYEMIAPFLRLIQKRQTGDRSWWVDVGSLGEMLDLDIKNPNVTLRLLPQPDEILEQVRSLARTTEASINSLTKRLRGLAVAFADCRIVTIGEVTDEQNERIGDDYTPSVRLVGVTSGGGISPPKTAIGSNPNKYKVVHLGDLVYNPMRVNIGSIGVATSDQHTGITSPDYVVFSCRRDVLPEYVWHYLKSEAGLHAIKQKTRGSVRFRLYYDRLVDIPIPLPKSRDAQTAFVEACHKLSLIRQAFDDSESDLGDCLTSLRNTLFKHTAD